MSRSKKAATARAKKQAPVEDLWTRARVNRLYSLDSNIGGRSSAHPGEPHEWELEDECMPPLCLGCNMTGDQVEDGDIYAMEEDEEDFLNMLEDDYE